MRRWLFPLVCVVLLAVTGPMGVVAQDEDDREVRQRSERYVFLLDEGETARLEVEVREGQGLQFVLRAGQRPIEFHLQGTDPDGEPVDHIGPKRTNRETGTFTAAWDGAFVFSFERQLERQAKVEFELVGEFGILAMHGMDPATEVPAPAAVLVLAVTGFVLWAVRSRRSG